MTTTIDIFDPESYTDVRRPAMEAAGLPFETYTSREWFEREIDRIFMSAWTLVCRADEIPEPGDYQYFEFLSEPIMIVRGKDGEVRAFSASCRHRGSPIVSESGKCSVFRCPYHSWTYALDGTLLGGPPEMQETKNFDKSGYGLTSIRLEEWAGFLFVNLSNDGPSLAEHLGDMPEKLSSYSLENMRTTHRLTYDVACNWKLYAENFMEEYHVATVHQKTIEEVLPTSVWEVEEVGGDYFSLYGRSPGSLALLKGDEGFEEMPGLAPKEKEGSYIILANPYNGFGFTVDMCWWVTIVPVSVEETRLQVGICFPEETTARDDFDQIAQNYYHRLDVTLGEDNAISELQQRGTRSRVNKRVGRLSYRERLVHDIANYVLDRVLEPVEAS